MVGKYNPEKYFNEVLPVHEKQSAELKARQQEEIKSQVEAAQTEALEENRLGAARKMVAEYELEEVLLDSEVKFNFNEIIEELSLFVSKERPYSHATELEDTQEFYEKLSYLKRKISIFINEILEKNGAEVSFISADGKEKTLSVATFIKERIVQKVNEKSNENKKDISTFNEIISKVLDHLTLS